MREIRYIQRDKDGNINGDFSHPEPGTEQVWSDDPELVAWLKKPRVKIKQVPVANVGPTEVS
jgi:hypothetical protein